MTRNDSHDTSAKSEPLDPLAERIWRQKYRLHADPRHPDDRTIRDTWLRVARAAARGERGDERTRARWTETFYELLDDKGFLPAGRILAGAESERRITMFNCFVMGTLEDDLGSIFANLREAAITLQHGGGIGQDFSPLRPRGAFVAGVGADASGPVSFMTVWDSMCRTIMSAGARRGAMMATLRCDHPDILEFIGAKSEPGQLSNFNLSVLVTDELIEAVRADKPFALRFGGKVSKRLKARELWSAIMRSTYAAAEPGVIFIDRVNALNNLSYCETISATNPCGEQPLPPYGACLLGSINLMALVEHPFEADARIDTARLEERVAGAVRLLDNIIDVSRFPTPAQAAEARAKRRIGIGITGLADALIAMGLHYDSAEARNAAAGFMAAISRSAYAASAALAKEKGSFPLCDREALLKRPNIMRLPADVRAAIARDGLRNGCLTSIAPTGTISIVAGNISSGIEPVFATTYHRRVLDETGEPRFFDVLDGAYAAFRKRFGPAAPLPKAFVTAEQLSPEAHLAMQAAVQPHVDSAISKTINCPEDISFADFEAIYMKAYDLGLKGCTTFRPGGVRGAVLEAVPPAQAPNAEASGGRDVKEVKDRKTGFVPRALPATDEEGPTQGTTCPDCESVDLQQIEGCWICPRCGYSPCA